MRLFKIKNRYLYRSNNPNGLHIYAVYYDKASKRNRAVGLTHLYTKDAARFAQLKRGHLLKMKFKEFEVPSGVKNSYFEKDVNGKPLNLKNKKDVIAVSKRYLSKLQSNKIKAFAKRAEK